MHTRKVTHEELLPAPADEVFALLHTPAAIRRWWSASRAAVAAKTGGTWAAAWGSEEDPDYVTMAEIAHFEPPRRLVLADYQYRTKSGPLPFDAEFVTEFTVAPKDGGALLRVVQDGFPLGPEADEFYAGCQKGWSDTFAGIRRYLSDAR